MTPKERRARLREILDQHNEAAQALREANRDFKASAAALVLPMSRTFPAGDEALAGAEDVRQRSLATGWTA